MSVLYFDNTVSMYSFACSSFEGVPVENCVPAVVWCGF